MREGYKDSVLGEIPEDWDVVKLAEVTSEMKSGLSRKLSLQDIGVPVIRSNNLHDGRMDFSDLKYWYDLDPQGARVEDYFLRDGDILVNFINSMSQIGKASLFQNDINRNVIYTTNVLKLRPVKGIVNEFLFYVTQTEQYRKFIKLITKPAVNQASFTTKDFKQFKVLVPPLPEQQKIAKILSTVDDKIDVIDQQIAETTELKKGLMQKLLTKGIGHTKFKDSSLGEIPESWEVVKVGAVCKLQGGFAFKSNDSCDSGIRWVKIANVGIKEIKWDDTSYLPETFVDLYPDFVLNEGNVVIAMTRPILSGKLKIAKIKAEDSGTLLNQRVGRVVASANILLDFVYQVFNSKSFIASMEKELLGTDPPNISSNMFEALHIALPKWTEQKKIANILSSVDDKLEVLKDKKSEYHELKKGLMQKLLTGKVRVKVGEEVA